MRCGSTVIARITGCLDLPFCGHTIIKYLKEVEHTMGQVQIMKKNESKMDVLSEEIADHEHHDDLITHECTIDGHEHEAHSMMKG